MQPIAGPIYRYDGSTATAGAFPRYYDGAWLINNRGAADGFWKEVRLRQDNNEMLRVNDWLPYNAAGTDNASLNSLVIGTQFGGDGALYMSRYAVGCCRNNNVGADADREDLVQRLRRGGRADRVRDARPGRAGRGPRLPRPGDGEVQRRRHR